ncbi:MAG: ABC transporter ATP-binding protein/permease [Saccharofermentans sp.]|nr:ABC transporter ATP-binding protein/permease [Saccharofermentans sp.]
MRSLYKHFKKHKASCLLSPLFKLLEACFELIVPLIVAGIIDKGIMTGDTAYIKSNVVLLGVFAVVGFVSAISAQYFAAYAASGISSALRRELFVKLQSLDIASFEKAGKSNLVTALTSDVNQISSGINLFLRLLLRSPFIVAGACIMAFTIDIKIALVFVITVALLSCFIAFNLKSAIPAYKKTRRSLDDLIRRTDNSISGVRVIRGYNRTGRDTEAFEAANLNLKKFQQHAANISSWLNPVTIMLVNLGICALIYMGDVHVNAGTLTTGEVVALYNYMSQILVELVKLANLIISVSRAIACVSRCEDILKIENKQDKGTTVLPSPKQAHGIEFRDVSFTYEGNSEPSIENMSFVIKPGERIGIIGRTGCGKSTAAALMSGMYDCAEGDIFIDGVNIKDISVSSMADSVGMALQKTRMFTCSIRDNITMGRQDLTDNMIKSATGLSCADDVISSKKDGFDYVVSSLGTGLSGGQKQRIGIARALASDPGLLIFDDSTSALDAATEKRFIANLDKLTNKPTVVFISQKVSTVRDCDRIFLIEDGKLTYAAPHEELLKISDTYRYFCSLQTVEEGA